MIQDGTKTVSSSVQSWRGKTLAVIKDWESLQEAALPQISEAAMEAASEMYRVYQGKEKTAIITGL